MATKTLLFKIKVLPTPEFYRIKNVHYILIFKIDKDKNNFVKLKYLGSYL
jgi:hypothetical protein